ncbi:MAG: selenocysteine-specific translation elongation factor [Chloroflexi bacterium]|nr:selenocysteine-specific translation elongation factor [Chloroflexota bacterium]
MYVIGTAGHVDHGKSTLIQALTGIDPDRLREEKERGMTIDLGFAWITLPSGREVSIVDVPGHERFIKNMLAGVGGIDLAMLVVAADESVMPQTREHQAILDLLQVKRGLAVITKSDLVDREMLELVQLEVEEVLAGTSMKGSPVLPVSATTGQGLNELLAAVDAALDATEERRDVGRPRLAVDRVFTMSGFGTVVTGTLIDGTLRLGQEVELLPSGVRGRVRGLQSHRTKLEEAQPGSRVAVNLSGVSPDEIARGEVLTIPGWLRPSKAIDVRLHLLADAAKAIPHNHPVTFFAHTTDTPAKVRLLEQNALEPGEETWAQVVLDDPVPLVRGDHFVIRSADATLGGGIVVDLHARRHRRHYAPTIQRLEVLAQGSPTAQLIQALEAQEPADIATLARKANISEAEGVRLAGEAVTEASVIVLGDRPLAPTSVLYTMVGWSKLSGKALQALAAFHAQYPLRSGMPREELRTRLGFSASNFTPALQHLVNAGTVVESNAVVRLPDHQVAVSDAQRKQMDAFVAALEAQPYAPSAPALDAQLVNLLVDEGRVAKATDGVVFATAAYNEMLSKVQSHLEATGKITVAEVRDMFGTSRKYALSLLEHLDELKVTRRTGDERVLMQR